MWCAWVDANDMWSLASRELADAFSSLCIPQFHKAIITGRNELSTTGIEINIVDRLGMARVCSKKLSLVVCSSTGIKETFFHAFDLSRSQAIFLSVLPSARSTNRKN